MFPFKGETWMRKVEENIDSHSENVRMADTEGKTNKEEFHDASDETEHGSELNQRSDFWRWSLKFTSDSNLSYI